jgi:hypothetical protein
MESSRRLRKALCVCAWETWIPRESTRETASWWHRSDAARQPVAEPAQAGLRSWTPWISGGLQRPVCRFPVHGGVCGDRGEPEGQPFERPGQQGLGYPSQDAAKIALGNPCRMPTPSPVWAVPFPAAIDYVAVKFPRWPFDTFPMRPTLESGRSPRRGPGIGAEFSQALLNSMRSVEWGGGLRARGKARRCRTGSWARGSQGHHRRLWYLFELLGGVRRRGPRHGQRDRPFSCGRWNGRQGRAGLASGESRTRGPRGRKTVGCPTGTRASFGNGGGAGREVRLAQGITQAFATWQRLRGEHPRFPVLYGPYGVAARGPEGNVRQWWSGLRSIRIGRGSNLTTAREGGGGMKPRDSGRDGNNIRNGQHRSDLSDALPGKP